MLWALFSSAFVIYLYRKLNAEPASRSQEAASNRSSGIGAEFDKLNHRLDSIEAKLAAAKGRETIR
jgi:hypothetical protein